MPLRTEAQRLTRRVEADTRFRVRPARSGLMVWTRGGDWVTEIPTTPHDYRGLRNARAALERAGLDRHVDRKRERALARRASPGRDAAGVNSPAASPATPAAAPASAGTGVTPVPATRVTDVSRARVAAVLAEATGPLSAAEVAGQAGVSAPTARAALTAGGWPHRPGAEVRRRGVKPTVFARDAAVLARPHHTATQAGAGRLFEQTGTRADGALVLTAEDGTVYLASPAVAQRAAG